MNETQVEVIDSTELAKRLNVPETWVRSRSNTKRTSDPIPHLRFGRYVLSLGKPGTPRMAEAPAGEHGQGMVKEGTLTRPVRYQKGALYQEYGAWFVRYREPVRQKDGSIKFRRRAKRLGNVGSFPRAHDIEPLRVSFMQRVNRDYANGDPGMTLREFVDGSYLPWVESERRASTSKGYREIWKNHMSHASANNECEKSAPFM
jgi:hypothetical protein